MKFKRSSGILLHPTSLPGRYGVGDLGAEAYRFVDWLEAAGQHLWQVLPLGPTGYGDSPYQCFSAFAGNTLLVSPDLLVEQGLLGAEDLTGAPELAEGSVAYGAAGEFMGDSGVAVRIKAINGTILVDETLSPEERANIARG